MGDKARSGRKKEIHIQLSGVSSSRLEKVIFNFNYSGNTEHCLIPKKRDKKGKS